MRTTTALLAFVSVATAFPGMRLAPGQGIQARGSSVYDMNASPARRGAEPYSSQYPYTGAILDGKAGTGKGGVQVPAPGDTDHEFRWPLPGAQRGPCPGLNAAANHGFLSRDGIITYDELVAMQQNVYNFGWDLSTAFAAIAIGYAGDIDTQMMSIGFDSTLLTSGGNVTSAMEPALDGHNTLEADGSLTRNDYWLAQGDDHSFNGTLFQRMIDNAAEVATDGVPMFNFEAMSKYRAQRYYESRTENPWFYFGPRSILQYTASALMYQIIPDSKTGSVPSLPNILSIFGAVKAEQGPGNATGGWDHVPERLPASWHNRVTPYGLANITADIVAQYAAYPVLYGANDGKGNFIADDSALNKAGANVTGPEVVCQIYSSYLLTNNVPDSPNVSDRVRQWVAKIVNPLVAPANCTVLALE